MSSNLEHPKFSLPSSLLQVYETTLSNVGTTSETNDLTYQNVLAHPISQSPEYNEPVIHSLSSWHKNMTTLAISAGTATLPSGIKLAMPASISSRGVSGVPPGA